MRTWNSHRRVAKNVSSVWGIALSTSLFCLPLAAQDASELRQLLEERVGSVEALRVPESLADFPQPRLEDGSLDPRFAITPEKVRLGKLLFFDPIRSTDIRTELGGVEETSATASCGTCHMGEAGSKAGMRVAISVGGEGRHEMSHMGAMAIERRVQDGFVDTLPTGLDVFDDEGNLVASGRFDAVDSPGRVSPSVVGFAFNNRLLWAGEAGEPNAEEYPAQEDIVRIASSVHRMANPDVSRIQTIAAYRQLFAEAFPEEAAGGIADEYINNDTQFRAIAAFLRTVITRDTPWDRFLAGDDAALNASQRRGAWLFAASAEAGGANCIACHSGPALNKRLGDEAGLLVEENFDNLGTEEHPLQELARQTLDDPSLGDAGRIGVTGLAEDAYEFKSPTLRQLRGAGPYFHGGELGTLREVVEYFNAGVPTFDTAAAAGNLSQLFTNPRGPELTGLGLDEDDVQALVEFLDSGLYDPAFVTYDANSPTSVFELTLDELTWSEELQALGAVDGWLPSGLPNGFNDELSRRQLVFVRGDVAPGGVMIDISDAQFIFQFLFLGGDAPVPMVAGDVNDDGRIDLADGIHTVSFLFRDGPEPFAPFPEPGQDLQY